MSVAEAVQTTAKSSSSTTSGLLLQRKCACGGSAGFSGECEECKSKKLLGKPLQRKLAINEPGDEYEREADRVAKQVMRMPDVPVDRDAPHRSQTPLVQRRVNGSSTAGIGMAPQIVHDVLNSPGQPIDTATRAFFEPRFGHDFSAIRIHADMRAADSARSVNARAFTVGEHIVFGAGEYAPQSTGGQQLLAHELVHSVQQSAVSNWSSIGGEPQHSISSNPEAVLNRWRIEGTEGVAEKEGENLKKLAKMLNAEAESWACIRPIYMTLADSIESPSDFNEHYDRYVSEGDRFDLSNLLASTGPSIKFTILNDAQINIPYADFLNILYPGAGRSAEPDIDIDLTAESGLTPIKSLTLIGHAGGSVMAADPSGNGKFSPVAVEKDSPDPSLTYEKINSAVPALPRRCWFTRDASVRVVGCDSVDFGINFARVYLRPGAKVITTTAAVRGVCAEGTDCRQIKALDFGMREATLGEDMTQTRVEGPFFNMADFHAADHWATVAHRGVRGWGIVRGREGNGARPASEILGEAGQQQVAAVRDLLSSAVSDQEVSDVLRILRSWSDEEVITSAWSVIGEKPLRRFLGNLKVDEHFVAFPLEVLASVAALDDATRNRKILNRTRGIANRRDAALAFFLVLDLDPADPAQMEALLGRRPARAQRRESRIAGKIQSALSYEVRVALVEAVTQSAEREEQGLPKERNAFTVELGNFSYEAAAEVVRQVEEHLQGTVMPSPEEQRKPDRDVVPTAEFLYVALRWLTEQGQDQLIAEIHEHLGSLDPYIAWIKWIATPDAQYIKEPTNERYRIALTKVLAQAAAPFADLIVDSLSRGRVTEKEANNAFGAFACLLGASPAQESAGTPCTGGTSQRGLARGTVQRIEELRMTNAWLEKLAHSREVDLEEPTNASVLNQVLSFRLPTLALSHVLQLLRADQQNPHILREDALLARKIIEAQPTAAAAAMRLELSAHPTGDLTTRLAALTKFETERIVEAKFDDWLRTYREAVIQKRWDASDLLEVLYDRSGETFNAAPDFPLQPANRDLAADLSELDRLGIFDSVLDQLVASEVAAPRRSLEALIPYRSPAANLSTMRRLIRPAPTKFQAQLAFEIHRAMPPEAQQRLKVDEELWGRMTEALPATFIESPTFGPKVELREEDKTVFLEQLDDPGIWMKNADGVLSPTLSVMLTLAVQAGMGPEVEGIVERHWTGALAQALGEQGFFRPDPNGPVRFSEEVVVPATEGERDVTEAFSKLAGSFVTGNPVVIEADNLVDWLSQGKGIFLDVKAPEVNPAIGAPNTFAINWFEEEGIVQAFASELNMSGSNAIFDSAVMRSGSGFLQGLTLRYKYKERLTPDQWSSMSADVLDLRDITIATRDAVYGVGHVRIEGASISADLKTGKPLVAYNSRIGGLTNLLFVFYDAVFAVIDIVTESILPDGKVKGAEALATAIVTRFQNRIALNGQVDSVLLEGVVVPGLGSIDKLSIGDKTDAAVNALALSLMSNVDWDRLSDLRNRWSHGKALTEDEEKERLQLERQILSLALNVEIAPFQAEGVRTVLLNKAGSADVTLALDVISEERSSVKVIVDSVKRGAEVPTEQGVPGTSTPLASLAALDDGVFKARLDLLHGLIGETSIKPEVERRGAPGVSVEPGNMAFKGGRIIILPDGTLYVEASDTLIKSLALRVRDYGVELDIRDLKVGRSTAQRLGPEIGALAQPAADFPAGKTGDWLVTLSGIQVIDVGLAIADVMALGPPASNASCKSPELLKLLDGLSGIVNITLSVTVPIPGALGGPTTVVQQVPVDLIINDGMVTIQMTGPGANFVHGALHEVGVDPTIPNPLSVIFGKAYESFLCVPTTAPVISVSGPAPSPTTWGEQLEQWTQAGLDSIKQGARDVLQQALSLTGIDVRSRNLRWEMNSVDLTDIATKLQLNWHAGKSMPLDLHLHIVPAPSGPGRMELIFHPFILDRAVGEAKGMPVLIDDLKFTRDLMLTVDFSGSGKPIPASMPLEGIELRELRLLLPAK